jgi:[ribosomal protein S18]-alanine N-acetyltransferase
MIDLRHGSARDLPAVSDVMLEAFDPRFGEAWTPSQCMGMLTLPGVWLTLAEQDGQLGGFALSRSVLEDGELLLLATRPKLRGRGIGRALLRAVVADAQARGVQTLHLEVRAGNEAIKLYTSEGFAPIGERRNYYHGKSGELFDAKTYARRLV